MSTPAPTISGISLEYLPSARLARHIRGSAMQPERHDIELSVNGTIYRRAVESRTLLSDFLRHDLELTGTHVGCEHGVCGACTVLVDGEAVRSCLMFAVQADGLDVQTVEALGNEQQLHPIQQAF